MKLKIENDKSLKNLLKKIYINRNPEAMCGTDCYLTCKCECHEKQITSTIEEVNNFIKETKDKVIGKDMFTTCLRILDKMIIAIKVFQRCSCILLSEQEDKKLNPNEYSWEKQVKVSIRQILDLYYLLPTNEQLDNYVKSTLECFEKGDGPMCKCGHSGINKVLVDLVGYDITFLKDKVYEEGDNYNYAHHINFESRFLRLKRYFEYALRLFESARNCLPFYCKEASQDKSYAKIELSKAIQKGMSLWFNWQIRCDSINHDSIKDWLINELRREITNAVPSLSEYYFTVRSRIQDWIVRS